MQSNIDSPANRTAYLSEFASKTSKSDPSPASVMLVSRQQVAREDSFAYPKSKTKTNSSRFQKIHTKKTFTTKQTSKPHEFEKILKFRSNKAFNLSAKGTDFYLLEGVNAFQSIRFEDRELKSANAIRFNEFTITDAQKNGGLRVAIASDNNALVILSGLISIRVNEESALEPISQKYALKPERIFSHLGLGYFKPSNDLLETYHRLKDDPNINEVKIEIVEERMQKQ